MPGALLLTFGIICHGLDLVDLIQLGGIACLHLVVGWIYLFISPLFLPRTPSAGAVKANPFAAGKDVNAPLPLNHPTDAG